MQTQLGDEYLKTCVECWARKPLSAYHRSGSVNGHRAKCKTCTNRVKRPARPNRALHAMKSYRKRRGTLTGRAAELWTAAKCRAQRLGVPFAITRADVEGLLQSRVCAATGLPFQFDAVGRCPYSPSLDRIVPELGYVLGNVQVTTLQFNVAKMEFGFHDLLRLASAIVASNAQAVH